MADLIVVAYDDEYKAQDVRLKLIKLQRDYLIDLEDAVVATKGKSGEINLHQVVSLTASALGGAAGTLGGGFLGSLLGLIFLNLLLGVVAGAASSALAGTLTDAGIDDDFMKELAGTLHPCSSALFVLVRKMTPDRVQEELRGTGGRILRTSLSRDAEQRLQEALSGSGSPSQPSLSTQDPGEPPVGATAAALGTGTQPQI